MKILVIDDEPSLLEAYRQAFSGPSHSERDAELKALAAALFSAPETEETPQSQAIELVFARQGAEGVELVAQSLNALAPFQLAFIDIRMPPGIDGKETARRIRQLDPDINLVIVSGYSDFSVGDIVRVAGPAEKIFFISKPFAVDEVNQMALALSQRWQTDLVQMQRLHEKVRQLSESEARAIHAAYHDFLTGAPNRASFQRHLSACLDTDAPFSVAMVDLDRFKYVNDTFGHNAGDELICEVTRRLRTMLPVDAFLARLSGDEFGVILTTDDHARAGDICQHIVRACSEIFIILGSSIQIGASVGLLLDKDAGVRSVTDLMRCADIALFAAKRAGRNRVCRFEKSLDDNQRQRRTIEAGLAKAIAGGELELNYQPIIDAATLEVAGFEALLRWKSAELGQISPAVFIPIAEESGLIRSVGDWVIRKALADCADWPNQYVAINLSARQFNGADMVAILRRHADAAGVAYHRVHVEVTETAFFDDSRGAADTLAALRALGFRIALDDFGTGYSSLFSVKNFPLDTIKIDKCFIDGLGNEPQAAPIISAVIHLARGLGLGVVAEGVETEEQRQALRLLGCSHLQGYLFARPQSRADTRSWLESYRAAPQIAANRKANLP